MQEIEESQQIELRLWRDKAQKAKIARLKALAKLEALATARPAPDKAKTSSGIQRASLASSIEQVRFNHFQCSPFMFLERTQI